MPASFEPARAAVLTALAEYAEADSAILASWLQGSLATGQADAFSDIDAYLAVNDADFESRWSERANLLTRLGGALAWSDATTPGLAAVHALMAGGARLDLFFEKASAVGAAARPAIRMLVDKAGVESALKLGWQAPAPVVARSITTIIRMTRQGATWPLRVLRPRTVAHPREDRARPDQRPARPTDGGATRSRELLQKSKCAGPGASDAEQGELADLTAAALAALQAHDAAALKAVHLRVQDALIREGRAACAALGVDYPIADSGEREIRRLLDEAWPV